MLKETPQAASNRSLSPAARATHLLQRAPTPSEHLVAELIRLVLTADVEPDHYLRDLGQTGLSPELACLDVLTPVARRLGAMWEEDTCSFVDVTVGVGKLQVLTHRLGSRFTRAAEPGSMGRALLGVAPGDQHVFGMTMVAEFLKREGWLVTVVPVSDGAAGFTAPLEHEWFDIVAISVATDRSEHAVRRLIADIRRRARNRRLGIMLGGPLPMHSSAVLDRVGADGWAEDAAAAARLAADLSGKCAPRMTAEVSRPVDTGDGKHVI